MWIIIWYFCDQLKVLMRNKDLINTKFRISFMKNKDKRQAYKKYKKGRKYEKGIMCKMLTSKNRIGIIKESNLRVIFQS